MSLFTKSYPCLDLAIFVSKLNERRHTKFDSSKLPKSEENTETWNGAISLSTSASARVDLFFSGLVRDCPTQKLESMLVKSWQENPEDTIRLIMQSRDCRHGKGEKLVSQKALLWLRKHKPISYLLNLQSFLNLGCYKDLLQMATIVESKKLPTFGETECIELEMFAADLQNDYETFTTSPEKSLTLAAKWAPSENGHFDKKHKLAKKLARLLFDGPCPEKSYRLLLSMLRQRLVLVETLMCENRWDEIKFSTVPSRAHHLLKKSFRRHQEYRYAEYIESVKRGESQINTAVVYPHEIVNHAKLELDQTAEIQWKSIVDKVKSYGALNNSIAMVDVSGSMTSFYEKSKTAPIDVAIALGILIAELNTGIYQKKVLTFSKNPQWHTLTGDSLHDKIKNMCKMDWGMNTDLQKALTMILETSIEQKISAEDMPKSLFIFSDMQFDSCGAQKTNFQSMKEKFFTHNYELPQIVFWNLQGKITDVPVKVDQNGVVLVSGFSPSLLEQLMKGEDLSPLKFMLQVLEKYIAEVDELEK